MQKTLIYYKPEYEASAKELRDNYLAHAHKEVDVISENEQDDIKYAREMQYDEAIFIEDPDTAIIHDIESGFTQRCPIEDVYYKD